MKMAHATRDFELLAGQPVLFIHQHFPGQFVHLAGELVRMGCDVKALAIQRRRPPDGIDIRYYECRDEALMPREDILSDTEIKTRRGLACAAAMRQLAAEGFRPALIVAHPGWGESMFCKDVWPDAVLVAYGEFYYHAEGADHAFDHEFGRATFESRIRLRMRNTALLQAYHAADAILCPTHWQRSRLPLELQAKACVIFDGIDTRVVRPDPKAFVRLNRAGLQLSRRESVLTFVNRNLEPYRGFHVFMRALPEILARNPETHCVLVGGDSVSYGSPPRRHRSWREAMLQEVGHRLPADRVHFVGNVPYAAYLRLLQVSTCHAYLTYPFVLSWSCIEAMAAGCRLVASDTPPVREVLTHGVNGRLTPFFDVPALAESVSTVLENPQSHDALAVDARREAVKYDLESICKPRQMRWLEHVLRDSHKDREPAPEASWRSFSDGRLTARRTVAP